MATTKERIAYCKITFNDHETVEFNLLSHPDGRMIADDQIPGVLIIHPG